jgi:hypothetical protein
MRPAGVVVSALYPATRPLAWKGELPVAALAADSSAEPHPW